MNQTPEAIQERIFIDIRSTDHRIKMPAYNSQIKSTGYRTIGNFPLLPMKSTAKNTGRGVAPLPGTKAMKP